MEKQFIIPDPEKKLAVIKRFLHIIALLQNPNDSTKWNGTSLADKLSLDEDRVTLTDKSIREYIKNDLKKNLGIDVGMGKGGRRVRLASPIETNKLASLINVYCLFVARDSSREIVLDQLMKRHPEDCLWMLASIYFAAKDNKRIECDYTNNQGEEKHYTLDPYDLVLRNNNLYLYCGIPGEKNPRLFIVNRIRNLKLTDQDCPDPAMTADEAFSGSLGSFIGKKHFVRIRYSSAIENPMEQFLSIIDPVIEKSPDGAWIEARFNVSDDRYLCKQLFMYGRDVEILEPKELREEMVKMLKESLGVYC
ncbi:MAG TPA: WYL domain-containing protein [Spirochaetota bacterium]|nr:WYL domain-containing protein [Spirochaetota bacterium]HRZ27090.1 WYL domain-containing protein [Spirochaetota bacterium]HSA16281.1 WYL domain-containing protein [Spirochaetota bacterium]